MFWNYGKGNKVGFYVDIWLPKCGMLKDHATIQLTKEDLDLKLSEIVDSNGN